MTTTALTTSPFLMAAPGSACFTEATMISPTPAYFLPEPPSTSMHMIRRAPELSATLSLVNCWIIWAYLLPRAFLYGFVYGLRGDFGALSTGNDLYPAPALLLRQGAGLLDAEQVSELGLVLFIVDLELPYHAKDPLVKWMRLAALYCHHHCLVHLVADDAACSDLFLRNHFSLHRELYSACASSRSE